MKDMNLFSAKYGIGRTVTHFTGVEGKVTAITFQYAGVDPLLKMTTSTPVYTVTYRGESGVPATMGCHEFELEDTGLPMGFKPIGGSLGDTD